MKTKKHSINAQLFAMTVLSVWLGLLIVSSPSQIYAQQVLSKLEIDDVSDFDDQAPITYELFLIKAKPKKKQKSISGFVTDLSNYVATSLNSDKLFSYEVELFTQSFKDGYGFVFAKDTGDLDKLDIARFVGKIADDYSGKKLSSNLQSLTLELNSEEFVSTVKLSNKTTLRSKHFSDSYNSFFESASCFECGKLETLVYQNTKAFADNNQVLIVTRLPRGSLDALLAAK